MSKLFCLLFFLLSFSSYSQSFQIQDKGDVKWTVRKDEVVVPFVLYRRDIVPMKISEKDYFNIQMNMILPPLGYRGFYRVAVEEKNVLEQVRSLVGQKMRELTEVPAKSAFTDTTVELSQVECERKGFFDRRTICTAEFSSQIDVELLK